MTLEPTAKTVFFEDKARNSSSWPSGARRGRKRLALPFEFKRRVRTTALRSRCTMEIEKRRRQAQRAESRSVARKSGPRDPFGPWEQPATPQTRDPGYDHLNCFDRYRTVRQ